MRILLLRCTWIAVLPIVGCGKKGQTDQGGIDPDPLDCTVESLSPSPLMRLSNVQYENSLRDLLDVGAASTVFDTLGSSLTGLPIDGDGGSFVRMDGRITQRHIDAYFDVADTASRAIAADDAILTAVAGPCATDATLTSTCLDAFLADFGLRAHRQPVTPAETDMYSAIAAEAPSGPDAIRDVVFAMLMSPRFLYQVQIDGLPPPGTQTLALTPYELASRLSFQFWRTMPDAALFDAAGDGTLATDPGFEAQLARVIDDDRTRSTIDQFYREWFPLEGFGGFQQTAEFDAFAAGENIDAPGTDHFGDMVTEVEDLTRYYTWEVEGTFSDVLTSDLSFTRSDDLARLYDIEPWDGTGTPPRFVADERSGLLTRAAFLITGEATTAPFHRGAFVRREILCDPLSPPDPNDLPPGALEPPEPDADLTTRERYADKVADDVCWACHSQFTPIGFNMESYDALGRFRTVEDIYDEDGNLLASLPVDTVDVPAIIGGDDTVVVDAVELSHVIAESGKADVCFAEHYFRYTYRRDEQPDDQCDVAEVAGHIEQTSIRAALEAIALQPAFRQRRVE